MNRRLGQDRLRERLARNQLKPLFVAPESKARKIVAKLLARRMADHSDANRAHLVKRLSERAIREDNLVVIGSSIWEWTGIRGITSQRIPSDIQSSDIASSGRRTMPPQPACLPGRGGIPASAHSLSHSGPCLDTCARRLESKRLSRTRGWIQG